MHKCDTPTSQCAASATARRRDVAGCDVVDSVHNAAALRRAVLRRAWSGWGAPDYLQLQLKQCRQIARDALATKPHSALPRATLDSWSEHTREEYADGGGRPQLGGVVREAPSLDGCRRVELRLHHPRVPEPPRQDDVRLCPRSPSARPPATVLGWDPDGPGAAEILLRLCGQDLRAHPLPSPSAPLPAHAVVLISDTDVVAQAASPPAKSDASRGVAIGERGRRH